MCSIVRVLWMMIMTVFVLVIYGGDLMVSVVDTDSDKGVIHRSGCGVRGSVVFTVLK